jgi:hypothetical protein
MDTKPAIKEVTFAVLDTIPDGFEFYSTDITRSVRARTQLFHKYPLDGTITRYMRHYSTEHRRIERVGPKGRSYYRMGPSTMLYTQNPQGAA